MVHGAPLNFKWHSLSSSVPCPILLYSVSSNTVTFCLFPSRQRLKQRQLIPLTGVLSHYLCRVSSTCLSDLQRVGSKNTGYISKSGRNTVFLKLNPNLEAEEGPQNEMKQEKDDLLQQSKEENLIVHSIEERQLVSRVGVAVIWWTVQTQRDLGANPVTSHGL